MGVVSAAKRCAITWIIAQRTDVRQRTLQTHFPASRGPRNNPRQRILRIHASRERA